MVLVIACPFQLHRLVVQEKALLGIEPDGANAESGRVAIDNIAFGLHLRHERVEASLFEGPELRLFDRDLLLQSALELAPKVRVNAVAPGYVLTPMQRTEYSDEMLEEVNQKIPLQRHAQPEEVAALFAFLASDDAAYVT